MVEIRKRVVLLYFDGIYSSIYLIAGILCFIYKGNVLPYPSGTIGWEVVGLFLYWILQKSRLFLGSMGNKTEETTPLTFSLLLTLPAIAANIYYLEMQIYVLAIERYLNIFSLMFAGLQIVFGAAAVFTFQKNKY